MCILPEDAQMFLLAVLRRWWVHNLSSTEATTSVSVLCVTSFCAFDYVAWDNGRADHQAWTAALTDDASGCLIVPRKHLQMAVSFRTHTPWASKDNWFMHTMLNKCVYTYLGISWAIKLLMFGHRFGDVIGYKEAHRAVTLMRDTMFAAIWLWQHCPG